MTSRTDAAPTLIGSVQRALRLVDIVANSSRPLPPKMLAAITGLTHGTTYNLVRTLVHEGYLRHEPDGLVLGARFPAFQRELDARGVFLAHVRSVLREVADEIGASAYLSRYDDGEIHLVDIVDADVHPRVDLWVGLQSSGHATALGKQILAGLSAEGRADYLSRHRLVSLTPRTVSDQRALCAQLDRSRGFVVDLEEYAIGTACLAVPVNGPHVTASLAISLPATSLVVDDSIVSAMQRAARRLSLRLGMDALESGAVPVESVI